MAVMPPRPPGDREGRPRMLRVRCPYCGEENVVGPLQEKRPGEPVAETQTCPHIVFMSFTNSPGVEYVHKEFLAELGNVRGSYSLEADLMRMLNNHFRFVGPFAFAPSERARQTARREVADFLRATEFNVPS